MDIGQTFFGNTTNKLYSISGIPALITLITRFVLVFASLALLFYFILGGIGMISSAGKGDPQKAQEAKKTVTGALIGFIVVFIAYWIVKLIGEILKIPNII